MSFTKILILAVLSISITQIINSFLDEFLLLGISRLSQAPPPKQPAKPTSLNPLSFVRTKLNSAKENMLSFVPDMSSLTAYGVSILYVLFGFLMCAYFISIFVKIWDLWLSRNGSLLGILFNYRSYVFLFVRIVFNLFILGVLLILSEKYESNFTTVNKNLNLFKLNYFNLTHAKNANPSLKTESSYSNLNRSILALKLYFYINNYISLTCSIANIALLSLLTFVYLLVNIFS